MTPGSRILTPGSMTPGSRDQVPVRDPRIPRILGSRTGLDVDPGQCWPASLASTGGRFGPLRQNPRSNP